MYPPYKFAQSFVEHVISKIAEGRKVCTLKVLFLESQSRNKLFTQHQPRIIYNSSSRINLRKTEILKLTTVVPLRMRGLYWLRGIKVQQL